MLQIGTLSRLDLGIKDENNARDLYIDMNTWYTDYPNATFSVWHKRNGDQTKYAASGVSFDRETGILKWTPDAYDTFYVGKGLAEIRCTENAVIKKTKDIVTEVERSMVLGSGETLAAGWQNFLNAVESAKNAATQAAEDAEEAILHAPYIDEDTNNWFVWDAEEEEYVDTGVNAGGDPTALIDDEAGEGDTDKAWSADKLTDEFAGKADVDADAVQGNFAEFDASGNPVDSGHKHSDYITSHQDISEKADKVIEATSGNFAGLDGNGNLTDSGSKASDFLTEHQDISGKADKVSSPTSGDFAGLDSNGNLTDSGKKAADFIAASEKGAASGVAELDANGKVPSAQLPSYVDDVQEYEDTAHFPLTGESGIIYVALDTNRTYRWGGSGYVEISESLALGETSSTAYRGDRGKAAYDHAAAKGSAFASGLYKVTTNAEGHVTAATAATKEDITALGIPGSQPDISGKADKDTDAVQGNFAAFDASGNPVDSGHKHSDYLTEHQDISGKVDKVEGYGLSKNDFSDAEKAKLDNMIDDTAGEGDTNKTWSADKLAGYEFALNRLGLCTYNGQFYINPDGNNVRTA